MDYEARGIVTVSSPLGVSTRVSMVELQEGRDELLAPAEEDNPETGPSEEESPQEGSRGLDQCGDPEEQEVIVIVEPEPSVEAPFKVLRVPRSPTQKDI